MFTLEQLTYIILLAPLSMGLLAGFGHTTLSNQTVHRITILGVAIAFMAAVLIAMQIMPTHESLEYTLYTWGTSGTLSFDVGVLLDPLSATMLLVVTFVSLAVHVYSMAYMASDPGYRRFFSYISLFTFAMLVLVLANNFMLLFFGWEGVGLVSYLLIGFWFKKDTATAGSLKAFLVNRVGDFGFIIGIALIFAHFNSIHYASVFALAPQMASEHLMLGSYSVPLLTAITLFLFIGAMGKSAQMPLHVWLPESMEGPTPISALIHAATMVTAGIYLIARASPLFEYAEFTRSTVLVIGATGALFTGLLAIVQNDIKRVIAYSTLSQLGYMVAGLGASAYTASLFHLATHACFKALLFLAAGSVILALHHEQDLRKMGALRRHLPVTHLMFLIGALSLIALPPFAGFYSKDTIIDSIQHATLFGASYAYICVLLGTFVSALYIFRAFFLTFYGADHVDVEVKHHLKESPWAISLPLLVLAIPSVCLGLYLAPVLLFSEHPLFSESILVLPAHATVDMLAEYHDVWNMAAHALLTLPFWFSLLGVFTAWFLYVRSPQAPEAFAHRFPKIYRILLNKYGFDHFNDTVIVSTTKRTAGWLYRVVDGKIIDHGVVNGSGRLITWASHVVRRLQSGYLYHYAGLMIVSVLLLALLILL